MATDYEIEQKHHTAFEKPNYTMTPNILFDELMKDMSESELKVTLCIIRKIVGYHKFKPEAVSLSQIQEMTGLSRQAASNGLEQALERGTIARAGNGKRGVSLFQLVHKIDQSTNDTSSGQNFRPVTSPQNRHTKEKINKSLKETPLPPEGDDAPTAFDVMRTAVKRLLRQYDKRQLDSITKTLLRQHIRNDSEKNLYRAINVSELEAFCVWWDKKKDRDGNKLTRPKNQASVLNAVTDWLDIVDAQPKKTSTPANLAYDFTPDYRSEDEIRAAMERGES